MKFYFTTFHFFALFSLDQDSSRWRNGTESCLMERQMQNSEINTYGKVTFRPNQVQVTCWFIICPDIKHILLELIFMIWTETINQQFYILFWKANAFLPRNAACTLAAHGARMLPLQTMEDPWLELAQKQGHISPFITGIHSKAKPKIRPICGSIMSSGTHFFHSFSLAVVFLLGS